MARTFLLAAAAAAGVAAQYAPTWESLDTRPLPTWYRDARFGIFIHFGIFSVPSFGTPNGGASGEWFWWQWQGEKDAAYEAFVNSTEAPNFQYPDYAPRFDATFFNATAWAELFKAAGARYVVPTSKHHEGWCNWPSATSFNWNSGALGPKRDIIGELAAAVKGQGITFGVYHSLFEWFNPLWLADQAANFTTNNFVTSKTMPELYDLVQTYEPELIWSDGDWEAPDTYWNSTHFLAWLANESPVKDTVVWNDRWGIGDICTHGSYFTCSDRYLPSKVVNHPWENAFTLDKFSWGWRRNMVAADVLTPDEVVDTIVATVALGGNALLNIGPSHDGTIAPIFQERLLQLGSWLDVNGEAIYASQPWRAQNDTAASTFYTATGPASPPPAPQAVYAIFSSWPSNNTLVLTEPIMTANSVATLLGLPGDATLDIKPLTSVGQPGILVTLPSLTVEQLPCMWSWTIKFLAVQ